MRAVCARALRLVTRGRRVTATSWDASEGLSSTISLTMKPTRSRRFCAGVLPLAAATLIAACSTAREDLADPSVPRHRVDSPRVLVLGPAMAGFQPGAASRPDQKPVTTLTAGEVVFFRNPDAAQFVQVRIDGDFAGCAQCVTVTGFACLKDGAISRAIEPGGVASVCFHEPGRFQVLVEAQGKTISGVLEVMAP